jgi:antitoxin VapB
MLPVVAKRKTSKAAARRVVRLFKNGRNQAVRIPREWELPGKTALVTKDGARLILEPVEKKNFIEVLRALGPLPPEDRFPDIDEGLPPAEPVDL